MIGWPRWWIVALVAVHTLGFLVSVVALMRTRTAQGTIGWVLALNVFPWIAVPAWWLFGRARLQGYLTARRSGGAELREAGLGSTSELQTFERHIPSERGGLQALVGLAHMPLLGGNSVEFLVDGEAMFEDLAAGIAEARETLLVQSYIVRDDTMGTRFQELLLGKAREGVRVRFLYDGAGSITLPDAWLRKLEEGGVEVEGFDFRRGIGLPSHLNFRNHRKIVVADGRKGWVGGLNIGEEYLGLDPKVGAWRDTHLRIEGPAVLGLQMAFVEDWHWATGETLDLDWTPHPAPDGADIPVLIVPSGPADFLETASLLIQHTIHSARRRVWIASPYFVPDEGVMAALHLAQLRGVEVRLLIAERADTLPVHLAAFTYLEPLLAAGVRVYRYRAGFLHAKTFLMDDAAAGVGTVNLDNRSFRLNFEITAILVDPGAAARMRSIFEADFARSRELTEEEIRSNPLWFQVACRAARVLSPIL